MSKNGDLKVYIAGRYSERSRLQKWREKVRNLGLSCDCAWMDETAKGIFSVDDDYLREHSDIDIEEVRACKVFILDTQGPIGGGGRFFEFGMAYQNGAQTVIIGDVEKPKILFETKATCRYGTWPEALAWLQGVSHADA